MTSQQEGSNQHALHLIDTAPFMEHADEGLKATDLIIEGGLPDDVSAGWVALIGDEALVRARELSAPEHHGSNILPRFTHAQTEVDMHRANLRAINPEGSALSTIGLSLQAVAEAALVHKRSRIARAGLVAKSGLCGSLAVAVAASQPLERVIPKLRDARLAASRKNKSII